jgi:glutamine phosphoribosylpyrophosphate amidotransferase
MHYLGFNLLVKFISSVISITIANWVRQVQNGEWLITHSSSDTKQLCNSRNRRICKYEKRTQRRMESQACPAYSAGGR